MNAKPALFCLAVGALTLMAGEPAPWPLADGPVGRYQIVNVETMNTGSHVTDKFTVRLDTMTGRTWVLMVQTKPGQEDVYWLQLSEESQRLPVTKLPQSTANPTVPKSSN